MTRLEKGIVYPWWLQHFEVEVIEEYAKKNNKFIDEIGIVESIYIK